MLKRVPLVFMAALLAAAAVSTVALAGVQVGPSAPNAQVGQYVEVEPETGGGNGSPGGGNGSPGGGNGSPGGGNGDVAIPTADVAVPTADGVFTVGAGGQLPFTGFVLLPLIMVGVLLILGAVALRRRDGDSPLAA